MLVDMMLDMGEPLQVIVWKSNDSQMFALTRILRPQFKTDGPAQVGLPVDSTPRR